ncbi:hypothetical protein DVH24_023899 [Malus domestica]|uniref:cellulase n=1 Tax=Malus domestica TaxID=3750 RepID=A0A498JH51_MALDO|nr:hypothetical protein DVH24_023899 [Malus domestica]
MTTKKHCLRPYYSSRGKTSGPAPIIANGWTYNTGLTDGYYDAGDNVKFGFPITVTTTMMAWSVIEFRDSMPPNELRNALVAIQWANDYLFKIVSQPNRIFVQRVVQGVEALGSMALRGTQS